MNEIQAKKMIENELKAFVYEWYSRFDKGTNMEELKPFLPDEVVEFVYPQATLTSVTELINYAEQTFSFIKSSAHYINEISVYQIGENKYEIICPHTYHALQTTGEYVSMDFIGRMKIETNLKTKNDSSGNLPKILAYKVALQGKPGGSNQAAIDEINIGDFSFTDAKAFVHNWFVNIDKGDADKLMDMTSNGNLDINIMGNIVQDKGQLKGFLLAQKESQTYSSHTPLNIDVAKDENTFAVNFVLHFEGDIKEIGQLHLSNITNWNLIEEDGQLKLKNYTLEIL